MDIYNFIRSMIFLIAALILILLPKKVNKFQNYMLEKLHIKNRIKYERKYYFFTGIVSKKAFTAETIVQASYLINPLIIFNPLFTVSSDVPGLDSMITCLS